MKNTIMISELQGVNSEEVMKFNLSNVSNKIDINTYFFLYRTGGDITSTKAEAIKGKKVDEELIEDVTFHLIKNYPEELESAFGNVQKKERLRSLINTYISRKTEFSSNGFTLNEISIELVNAIAGLDKIDTILAEHTDANGNCSVTDIMFNGTDLWIQTSTEKPKKSHHKMTAEQIHIIAKKIANATGQLFTTAKPELDTELPNLRINAVHKAVSPYGTSKAIRVFSSTLKISEYNFIQTLGNQQMLDFLIAAVKANLNIVVSGETGTGKTELIKFLVGFILEHHGIDIIEDTLETDMKSLYPEKNITNWRTRYSETDVDMIVDISRLLRSAMRNNPNWIIPIEARGGEAYDIIKAAGTGHAIMTSIHSRSTHSSGGRLINMAKEKADFSTEMLGEMIAESLDIVVHLDLDDDTRVRRIEGIGEYVRFDKTKVIVNNIFEYTVVGTKVIQDKVGMDKIVAIQEHTTPFKMSDDIAKKMLKKGVLTPSLLPLVSDEFKRNVMRLNTTKEREREMILV